jgi:hypothetical protein
MQSVPNFYYDPSATAAMVQMHQNQPFMHCGYQAQPMIFPPQYMYNIQNQNVVPMQMYPLPSATYCCDPACLLSNCAGSNGAPFPLSSETSGYQSMKQSCDDIYAASTCGYNNNQFKVEQPSSVYESSRPIPLFQKGEIGDLKRASDNLKSLEGRSRRPPRYQRNILFKTILCRDYLSEDQTCPRGEKCQFAHGIEDCRNPQSHPLYRSKMCSDWLNRGFCQRGNQCYHAHSKEQLRLPRFLLKAFYDHLNLGVLNNDCINVLKALGFSSAQKNHQN